MWKFYINQKGTPLLLTPHIKAPFLDFHMGKKKLIPPTPIVHPQPTPSPLKLHRNGSVVVVSVQAKAGAKTTAITRFTEESVCVSIAAPPKDGEANSHLIKFFSQVLGVKKTDVTLDSGSRARYKVLSVSGLPLDTVEQKIKDQLGGCN